MTTNSGATTPTSLRRDTLALPPVPPPASDAHPWRDGIVTLMFVLGLVAALAWTVANRNLEVTAFENRRTAPWPGVPRAMKEMRAWPAAFEAAFMDRFGGRDTLIALHHFTKAVVFEVSPVTNLMIGQDGWLFFLGEDGKSLDRDYRGVASYAPEESARVAAEFKRRHDYLAARGIPYIVMIVPDKYTIYPEYLPSWVRKTPNETRLNRLYAALLAYPEIRVLDLRPALVEAKQRERVYFQTDSHWNYLGAEVAYRQLVAVLKPLLPSLPGVVPQRPPYDSKADFYSGDLTKLLGLPDWFEETDIAPFAKFVGDTGKFCAKESHVPLPPDYPRSARTQVYTCNRPQLPTALMLNDSMGEILVPMLSENFRRIVYVSDRRLDPRLVEYEKPDVVIDEMVERSIHAPAELAMK